MTLKNNDNRTLLIYTSLIFIVAMIMIIVSFFAQTHLDQSKIGEKDAELVSLSNKASQVSEENMQLLEFNKSLQAQNAALSEENETLKTAAEDTKKELDGYEALFKASKAILDGKTNEAKTLLSGIYTEDLTSEQKEIYDTLVKKTE